jgi:hypothetical protein
MHSEAASERSERTWARRVLWLAGWLALDLLFLHWLWQRFDNWGIWDWDYHQSLLEVARRSVVEFGQLPLWNPFFGGGVTLIGHPLGRGFNPSVLPVLALGTIHGIKLAILLYLLLAQYGMFRLAGEEGCGTAAATLAALVFSLGGCHAQHLAHGHFEWLAYAWLPLVLLQSHRVARGGGWRPMVAGGLLLALLLLDGGPYQLAFVPLFLTLDAVLLASRHRSLRPLIGCAAIGLLAVCLAAVKLLPVTETLLAYPRPTADDTNFYGAPFRPGALDVAWQGLLSRDQAHDPAAWMPWVLNVGCYVGWIPVLLASTAMLVAWRRAWPTVVLLVLSSWIALSDQLPWGPWHWLHRLPGYSSLQVPVRFNAFVLLVLALLAGSGLGALLRRRPRLSAALVALVALDLLSVNAGVFKAGFAVQPFPVERREDFAQHLQSPWYDAYEQAALDPLYPHWPNATWPAVLENAGVLLAYIDFAYERNALPMTWPTYPGAEVFSLEEGVEVTGFTLSPNRVEVSVDGGGGRVVVNGNHAPGWRLAGSTALAVEPFRGLLSVSVPPGPQALELVYRPRSFVIGATLSLATLLAVVALAAARRRGHR